MNVIAYGGLLNPQELEKRKLKNKEIVPIKIQGYRRIFNQKPRLWKGRGRNTAVLNIEPNPNSWLNAIVIFDYPESIWDKLKQRERGYNYKPMPLSIIYSYSHDYFPEGEYLAPIGKAVQKDNTILPNPDYLKICLAGAKNWGDKFYEDFLATTYINHPQTGEPILLPVSE